MVAEQVWLENSELAGEEAPRFYFKAKDKVLATHREIQTLRYCSNLLKTNPERKVVIVGSTLKKHTGFIMRTLCHLGVSCGQIVNSSGSYPGTSEGIWLLITD